jgi:general secretion pathway protein J
MIARKRPAGFTLIELAVSLALLGLMIGLIGGVMPVALDGAARSRSVDDELSALQAVQNLLRHQIGEMPVITARQAHREEVLFTGGSEGMRFPAYPVRARGPGGPQWVSLSIEKSAAGDSLIYSAAGETRRLVKHAASVRFAYFGKRAAGKTAMWQEKWENPGSLPNLVRIQVKTASGMDLWPDLVIRVHAGLP